MAKLMSRVRARSLKTHKSGTVKSGFGEYAYEIERYFLPDIPVESHCGGKVKSLKLFEYGELIAHLDTGEWIKPPRYSDEFMAAARLMTKYH